MADKQYQHPYTIQREYERAEELKEWRKRPDEWRKQLFAKEEKFLNTTTEPLLPELDFADAYYDWTNWHEVYGGTGGVMREYGLWRKYYREESYREEQHRRQCRQYIIHALMIVLAFSGICVLCIYL